MLQIILVGQTDLEALLSRPELRQLQQRVSRRIELKPSMETRCGSTSSTGSRWPAPARRRLRRPARRSWNARWPSGRRMRQRGGRRVHARGNPGRVEALGGLPRVIDLVCDRSLEAAYAFRRRTIDVPVINTAARELGMAQDTVWTGSPGTSFQPAAEAVPVAFSAPAQRAAATSVRTYLVVAASLVAAAAVIWLGVRTANPPTATRPGIRAGIARPIRGSRPRPTELPHSRPRDPAPVPARARRGGHGTAHRRTLRHRGGVLPDRRARHVGGGRDQGARSADSPARVGRLATGSLRPIRVARPGRGSAAAAWSVPAWSVRRSPRSLADTPNELRQ